MGSGSEWMFFQRRHSDGQQVHEKLVLGLFGVFFFFSLFFAELCGLRDLNSPTRIEPSLSAVKVWSPNRWTMREFLKRYPI